MTAMNPGKLTSLVLLVAWSMPSAAQVDTSDWKCELCPFEDKHEANYEAGAMYVSDDAARFGNGTGLDSKGAEAILNGDGRYASDDLQLQWNVDNLGLDSREVEVSLGSQGRYGLHFGYNEIPYRLFDTTRTVFTPEGNDTLRLPPGWVAAGTTGGMTALADSLTPRNIESDRTIIGAGGHYLLSSGFRFFADYRREDKEGVQIMSGSSFTQSSMLPRMIDYQTDTIDAGVRYARGPLTLSLAWYGSFFKNNAASLTWENPFFDDPATPGFEPFSMALEPDNDFQQISLSGAYRFSAGQSVLGFAIASGSGTQNQAVLPYSSNPALNVPALPRAQHDGKVDTANYSVTFASRPFNKTRIRLGWHYDERDNKTPRDTWTRVITDTIVTADPVMNTPYSFDRSRLDAGIDYDLFNTLTLSAGYRRTALERDFQEVAEQTEDDGWARARWQPLGWLDVAIKGGAARREIDRYDESVAASFGQNPLLRKYNLAYRYRTYGELLATFAPSESRFSATVSAMLADDSYTQSQLGMSDADNAHLSVDLNWLVSENSSAFIILGSESIDADQTGSESFAQADWTAQHRDTFTHYGGGVEIRNLGENTDLLIDYTHSDGETGILVYRTGMSPSAFPDIDTDFDSLRARLRYRRSDRLDIDLNLRYEQFSSNDWALAGVEPDTIPTVLTLGAAPYDYDVWVVGVSFRYLVGGRDIAFPE